MGLLIQPGIIKYSWTWVEDAEALIRKVYFREVMRARNLSYHIPGLRQSGGYDTFSLLG